MTQEERSGPHHEAAPHYTDTTVTRPADSSSEAAAAGWWSPVNDQPYQLLPPLADDEYAALRDDIAANGVRVPVDVDEHGQILDGHHRCRIAAELGVQCPTRVVAGLTEDGKRQHAIAVNVHRRALTREQRRALVYEELKRDPDRSDRAIARIVGVDHKTVGAIRRGGWGIPQAEAALTVEEAELLTESIRRALDRNREAMATLAVELLDKGASRLELVGLIAQAEREAALKAPDTFGDFDIRAAMRKVLFDPLAEALLSSDRPGAAT